MQVRFNLNKTLIVFVAKKLVTRLLTKNEGWQGIEKSPLTFFPLPPGERSSW